MSDERLHLEPIDINRLYQVNQSFMRSLEQKAISFINEQHDKYAPDGFAFVCAFSGGKDSLVLLDLCDKAMAPDDFYVVFSNTGMELSDTLESVVEAKKRWSKLRFEEAKCHKEPNDTWDEFGPPARRLRWCCSVHKSVPTVLKLREITNNFNVRAIIYDGVRAEESIRRSTYDEVVIGAKSVSQINCHPILKWNSAELYIYLLFNDILLNKAYRYGLSRVGCMVCPMSSSWSEGIIHTLYKDESQYLVSKVEDFAVRAKTKKEAKKYVESGGWKARVGGRGLAHGGERVIEKIENNSITFTIHDRKQDWLAVAAILGAIVEFYDGKYIQKIGGRTYDFSIKKTEEDMLVVSYYPYSTMDRFLIRHLRGLASKVGYCIGCKNCMVKCPTGAFIIQPDGTIFIREKMCIHCGKCIDEMDKGCLVADNLKIQNGGSINMTNLDPYRGFGFRQAWLEHFIEDGMECFNKAKLGMIQYNALRSQLRDSGIIQAEKIDGANQFVITPLGQKICAFGPYNPFTWSIIWANMAYNTSIVQWYCKNVDIGEYVEKGDLVVKLGEISSERNRKNAVNTLFDTFKNSPVGSFLMQGITEKKGYIRVGWEMPHAVALLYALYLYAEHTGRRSFTFSELVAARNNPEATGMSPSDIFGIDVKAFREQVQGLAIQFPNYIRVSFISNLDNIILEDHQSLDILDLAEE